MGPRETPKSPLLGTSRISAGNSVIRGVCLWRSSTEGGTSSFPLLTTEKKTYLGTPYREWAPAPHNDLNHSCYEVFPTMYNYTKGMKLPAPHTEMFKGRLQPLKAKLRNGMAPMSRDRWLERKMDDPQNYRNLMELMQDILNIFNIMNHDQVLGRMRNAFNFVVDRYVEFESAANLLREQNGVQEKLSLSGMWAEYYHDIISNMSNRTQQWLVDRVDEVQDRAFAEYNAALEAAGSDQEAIGTAGKIYYECVQDLRAMITRVDYTLALSMEGFKGYIPSGDASDLSLSVRRDAYLRLMELKSWNHQKAILDAQDEEEKITPPKPMGIMDYVDEMKNGPKPASPRFRDHQNFIGHYHEGKRNRAEVRKALRGEPALGEEYWITKLKESATSSMENGKDSRPEKQGFIWDRIKSYLPSGQDSKRPEWGFTCYRLTYKQTDSEWAEFMRKLEADALKPGNWIEGYDSIVNMARLDIIDGRDVGIPEGDIEAAKRHFKSLKPHGELLTNEFLVIDHQSYASYSHPESKDIRPPPPYGPCFGDNGGHVRLVDTLDYEQDLIDVISPGYKGEMKVLSSLIFQEVYPLLATSAVRPVELFPLSRLHPREVYVGHTIPAQESWWEFQRLDFVHIHRPVLLGAAENWPK